MKSTVGIIGSIAEMESHKPLGLGNSDNSCYQNSILQGLASLLSLREYLSIFDKRGLIMEDLYLLLSALNSPERPTWKPFIWTPARLKNMDSVTQQDAQEYFSKLVDEICKEAAERLKSNPKPGLEGLNACTKDASDEEQKQPTNPLEGLIAQRVVCTTCGFSEGLSLTPFNCLTVPLEREEKCSVGQCLDDYTKAEDINGVECVRCTLLAAEKQLTLMLGRCDPSQKGQKEFYDDLSSRLSAVKYSLRNDVYSDKNLRENCKISKSNYRCSTKTRQAVIARAPKALAIHINRSVFNEATFELVKNHATVDFDMGLNLSKWMLGPTDAESPSEEDQKAVQMAITGGKTTPEIKSLLGGMNEQVKYNLRAVVAHYGRHDDGHYVCFRQHAVHDDGNGDNSGGTKSSSDEVSHNNGTAVEPITDRQEPMKSQWWVFSDEDVRPYPEEGVLAQKGAFMLFYELEGDPLPAAGAAPQSKETECPSLAEDVSSGVQTPHAISPSAHGSEELSDISLSTTDVLFCESSADDSSSSSMNTESEADFFLAQLQIPKSASSAEQTSAVMETSDMEQSAAVAETPNTENSAAELGTPARDNTPSPCPKKEDPSTEIQDLSMEKEDLPMKKQDLPMEKQDLPVEQEDLPVEKKALPNEKDPFTDENCPPGALSIPTKTTPEIDTESHSVRDFEGGSPPKRQRIHPPMRTAHDADDSPAANQFWYIGMATSR